MLTVNQCAIAMVGCLSTVCLYVKVLWSTLRHMLLVTLRNAASLQSGIAEQKQRLDDCLQLRKALTVSASDFVSSTLTDMATVMNTTTTHSLRTTYLVMLAIALPATLLQIACLVIGVMTDVWWPLPGAVLLAIALAVAATKYYRSRVQYLCPACHETFQPGMREFVFAAHTPKTRKLTCPHCGHRGHCMELSI